ncbi:MAG: S1 RNA-binding domain-containing protein, partial [Clostridiales bacterium]|nr:S1 RNA-binding domain-containing protein [Clostridiales bacterium]
LLHVSHIAKEHIDKPSDVLKNGEEVTAKIVDFNEAENKISLSIKALLQDEDTKKKEEENDEDVVSVDVEAAIAAQKDDDKE